MKNSKTILRLLVACSLVGAVLWAVHSHPVSLGPEVTKRLVPEPLREVDHVILTQTDGTRIEIKRDGMSSWQIVHPVSAPAAADVVMKMLDAFEKAPCEDFIDKEEMALRGLSPIDFGADKPRGRIVISGPRLRVELAAGASTPASGELFVSRGASVIVTDPAILSYFEMPVEAFSDTRIFWNDPRKANVVTLNRGRLGFVKLVRDPDYRQWKITQPSRTRADWDAVKELFNVLYSARISRYAQGDFPQETIPADGYGLDGPDAIVVQVATPEDPVGQVLTIGSYLEGAGDQVFVRPGTDGVVSVVTGAVRRVASQSVSNLRDKGLFIFHTSPSVRAFSIDSGTRSLAFKLQPDGDCLMTSPVSDKASPVAVSRLLDSLLGLSATRFLEIETKLLDVSPVATISVDTSAGLRKFLFTPAVTNSVPIGEENSFFAIPGEASLDPAVSVVTLPVFSSASLSPLFAAVGDPRPLLSRTMLQLDAKEIRRITMARGSSTSAVERVDGTWQAGTQTNSPSLETLSTWLDLFGDLKASRVEALSEGTNDLYSIASPSAVLTVDLFGGATPRVVLLLGERAPDGGVYCRLQGHDIVFILSEATERKLSRPLVVPFASQEAGDPSAAPQSNSSPRKKSDG